MARKRGGLAGFYDRNKGIIQKAVPAALSFIPGAGIPLAAGAGALMRGLDRPGKAGIGFDPFAALKGGVEGAVVGAGTQGARALLTGGGPLVLGHNTLTSVMQKQGDQWKCVNLSETYAPTAASTE